MKSVQIERFRPSILNQMPSGPIHGYNRATVLACVIAIGFTLLSLKFAPSLYSDPGYGMLQWRGVMDGNPISTVVSPDRSDISKDHLYLQTWWSPGQYLVPGLFTLSGLRLGRAIVAIAGISLLSSLLGWIHLLRRFGIDHRTATLAVFFVGTFRYSTLPFGAYNGGEVLLQGLVPWLIAAAIGIPDSGFPGGATVAAAAFLAAFFAKLTGLMVAAGAFITVIGLALLRTRRLTSGIIGAGVGAGVACALIYRIWFSLGPTPGIGAGWPYTPGSFAFAFAAPWGASVSWLDLCNWLLLKPGHPALGNPLAVLWLEILPAALLAPILWRGFRLAERGSLLRDLLWVTLGMYLFTASALAILFLNGGGVSVEERHLRAAGTLIFVSALAIAGRMPNRAPLRLALIATAVLMSVYGVFSFVNRARAVAADHVDSYSWTSQPSVNADAVAYAREAFIREGRDAVFVVSEPGVANIFPPGARLLAFSPDFELLRYMASRHYAGRVRGHIYIVLPTRLIETERGWLVLKTFVDYPSKGWQAHRFAETTIFVQ